MGRGRIGRRARAARQRSTGWHDGLAIAATQAGSRVTFSIPDRLTPCTHARRAGCKLTVASRVPAVGTDWETGQRRIGQRTVGERRQAHGLSRHIRAASGQLKRRGPEASDDRGDANDTAGLGGRLARRAQSPRERAGQRFLTSLLVLAFLVAARALMRTTAPTAPTASRPPSTGSSPRRSKRPASGWSGTRRHRPRP